ncbi:MAG: 2-oxo-4-hydroxy-4-carboxy-5-ureidoimidazoline decarboxylase, partial [Caldimonas sp.]
MTLTLAQLSSAGADEFTTSLAGIYEHSPWVAERAFGKGPFTTLAQLKRGLVEVVNESMHDEKLALLRAHPELAGQAMAARTLTAESAREQHGAGLTQCTAEELASIGELNAAYTAKFGFPFMLAVRGPRGTGLDKAQIFATFARRLEQHADFELEEALRNVHRVAELRLDDRFDAAPALGQQAWDCAELLATHSDPGTAERGQLTVTYLTDAHRACAAQLSAWMTDCGFDEVSVDAVGNVVGVYRGSVPGARALLTGSHFDTVRNAGRYDGRLGILVPMICVRELHRAGRRLPFAIEVVGFAEEEGQRYKATFLGSGALLGQFDPAWLAQCDA